MTKANDGSVDAVFFSLRPAKESSTARKSFCDSHILTVANCLRVCHDADCEGGPEWEVFGNVQQALTIFRKVMLEHKREENFSTEKDGFLFEDCVTRRPTTEVWVGYTLFLG